MRQKGILEIMPRKFFEQCNNASRDFVWNIAIIIVPILCIFLTYVLTNASAPYIIVERLHFLLTRLKSCDILKTRK